MSSLRREKGEELSMMLHSIFLFEFHGFSFFQALPGSFMMIPSNPSCPKACVSTKGWPLI